MPSTKAASSEEMCSDSVSGELRLRLRARRGGLRLRLALRSLRAGDAASRFTGDRLRDGERLRERRRVEGAKASRMSAS